MAYVVAVAQQKGGAGKSTVAANLAAALAGEGHRVALLDTDPQASLQRWHEERVKQGGKAQPLAFDASAGWRVSMALDKLKRGSDFVILDTPPHAETEAKLAIRAAKLFQNQVGHPRIRSTNTNRVHEPFVVHEHD